MLLTQLAKSVNPQPGDVYVNPVAEQFVVAFFQQQGGLHDIFPAVPVALQSGIYFDVSRGDALRNKTELKAPGAALSQIGVGVDNTPTYSCKVYEAEFPMTPEMAANYRLPIARDQFAARTLGRAAYLRREKNWVTSFFTTGVWTTDLTPSTLWDDPASDPIGDIETGIERILLDTGYRPNMLALGYQVWKALKQHPDILNRIGTGSASNMDPRNVTPELIAGLFGLKKVRIGEVIENTAAAGASVSTSFVAGKNALLCYSTETPSIMEVSAGYMFAWEGLVGTASGIAFRSGQDPRSEEYWYQIKHAEDFKKVSAQLGYFFSGAVS